MGGLRSLLLALTSFAGCVARIDFDDVAFACADGRCPSGMMCLDGKCMSVTPGPDARGAADASSGLDGAPADTDHPTPADADGDAGPALACADNDLGSTLGSPVASGTTVGMGDDFARCAGGGSPDVSYAWRAPQTGRFHIDTCGSGYDTLLVVLDGACDGARLDCSDDACGLSSVVDVDLTEGQGIVIIVDGYQDQGDYQLEITGP